MYALGEFSTTLWDEEEWDLDEPQGDDPVPIEEDDSASSGWDHLDRYDEIAPQAAQLTSRRIQRAKAKPYLLSTTPQAKLQQVHNTGWQASLAVAIVPAALAVLLIWLRFG